MKQYERKHTIEAIKDFGEVFTPLHLVDEILSKIPKETLLDPKKTIADISGCGNGNFLIRVLEMRMKKGISHEDALSTIYGIDINETNVFECKKRLAKKSRKVDIWDILNHNIICADALDPTHKGWDGVGYMWNYEISRNKWFYYTEIENKL